MPLRLTPVARKSEECLVGKYALAKEVLETGYEKGKELSLDEADVTEVMVVQSIQDLIRVKGANCVKEFLKY